MKPITSYPHYVRAVCLLSGLFLLGLSIAIQARAGLGFAPWTVLADGLSKKLGISLGQGEVIIGVSVIVIDLLARERIGLGTLCTMFLVGLYVDVISSWNIIPPSQNLLTGVVMLSIAIFIFSIGCVLYMGAGYGAGPRDSMMVAVMKWTGKSMGLCRMVLEVSVLLAGFMMGGSVGIGTVFMALFTGHIIGAMFRAVGCDAKKIQHIYLIK